MSDFLFSEEGFADYLYWQTEDRRTLRKINALLKSISRTPFEGEGHPEALREGDGRWSRRISHKDRLIYRVDGERVTIYQCRGHYDDK